MDAARQRLAGQIQLHQAMALRLRHSRREGTITRVAISLFEELEGRERTIGANRVRAILWAHIAHSIPGSGNT